MSSKRYFQTTDIELLVPMVVLALLFSFIFPALPAPGDALAGMRGGAIILGIGFLLLLAAKISLFRRRIWTSWGPKQMTLASSLLYKAGYVLMGIGTLILVAAYRALH